MKNKLGSKPKIDKFVQKAKEILLTDVGVINLDVIVCTDKTLVELINSHLEPVDQISLSTFEKWKTGQLQDNKCDEFLSVYKKALEIQNKSLLAKMVSEEETKAWQRYAWIIERKFKEWNLKKITETTGTFKVQNIDPLDKEFLGNV